MAKVNGNRRAAWELNVGEKHIREWRKQWQSRGPKVQWPHLKKELCDWIKNQRENGCFLSTVLIRIKMKQMEAEESQYILDLDHSGATDFLKEIILPWELVQLLGREENFIFKVC